MQSNRLDHQITFSNTFFPIKLLNCFVSIVYLNLFLNKVVAPSANFFLSFVPRLNSSTFLHFILVYFFEFCFLLKQSNFLLLFSHLIHLNPCNCFCALNLFPCEFLIRAFSRHHRHPPPSQKTPNQRPINLPNKHYQWEQKAMPPLQAKWHKIQNLWQVWNGNVPIAPILMRRLCQGLFLEILLRLDTNLYHVL